MQISGLGTCEVMVNQSGAPDAAACPFVRKLYIASLYLNAVLTLDVCMLGVNVVSPAATAARAALAVVAGVPFSQGGFRDGPAAQALFHAPVEVTLTADCQRVYISDFCNDRVRVLNVANRTVATVVGGAGGGCWTPGTLACAPGVQACQVMNLCAAVYQPSGIGLSPDGATIYLSAQTVDAVMEITGAQDPSTARMDRLCGCSASNALTGTVEMCDVAGNPSSKGCAMIRPFDVVVFGRTAFVGWTQGLTAVYLDDRTCGQIAGLYFQSAAGFKDGVGPTVAGPLLQSVVSQLNFPLRLGMAHDKGVLYFADWANSAVRRIQVISACTCPPGYTALPGAFTCYNPSPRWLDATQLPPCQPGFYALPGDANCSRPCSGAGGAQTGGCLAQQATASALAAATSQLRFAQVAAAPEPGGGAPLADWYGSPAASAPSWDAAYGGQSPTLYSLGQGGGRAPWGGEYVSARYDPAGRCWAVDAASPPSRLLPGIWYPCAAGTVGVGAGSCSCPNNVAELANATELGGATWQSLRLHANGWGARSLAPSFSGFGCPPPAGAVAPLSALASQRPAGGTAQDIDEWSRFVMMGTAGSAVPGVCGAAAAAGGGGTCFVGWAHFRQAPPTTNAGLVYDASQPVCVSASRQNVTADAGLWLAAGVQALSCYAGWPAHYACPDGFAWVGPGSPSAADMCTGSPPPAAVTCLSCMPGQWSASDPATKASYGGPYQCLTCVAGYYASGAGSTTCTGCPDGSYAAAEGSTNCTACAPGTATGFVGAPSADFCRACAVGTGSCASCLPGQYQPDIGQLGCLEAPAGSYTDTDTARMFTPCPPGTFQRYPSRTSCDACPPFTYTSPSQASSGGSGATGCVACADPDCPLAVNNSCGTGCGINRYYNTSTGACLPCPAGSFSPLQTCAVEDAACFEDPRRDYILAPGATAATQCADGQQANAQFTACVPCAAGHYSRLSTGMTGCALCTNGSIAAAAGASSCTLCAAGYAAPLSGMSVCAVCPAGKYTPGPGHSVCAECAAGTYAATTASASCQVCATGTYNNVSASASCGLRCDGGAGLWVASGGTVCTYCAGGTVDASLDCVGCGLGRYIAVVGGSRVCAQCPPGTVSLSTMGGVSAASCVPCGGPLEYAGPNGTACINASDGFVPTAAGDGQQPCPTGTYRLGLNETQCLDCPAGSASDQPHATSCPLCVPGKHASGTGSVNCLNCPAAQVSEAYGAVSCSQCAAGKVSSFQVACVACGQNLYSAAGGTCYNCPANTVSDPGSSACHACAWGTVLSGGSCQPCPPGTYYTDQFGVQCNNCPYGTYLPTAGGTSPGNCTPCLPGLVALGAGYSACAPCVAGYSVIGVGTTSACTPCGPGTGGVGCAPCTRGRFAGSTGASACSACPAGSFSGDRATACTRCPAGTYAGGANSTACSTCPVATTFSGAGQPACTPRRLQCEEGEYLVPTMDPTRDNACAACEPCTSSQVAVYQQSGKAVALSSADVSAMISTLCSGNGTAPLFLCVSTSVSAGMHLVYMSPGTNVGTAAAGGSTSAADSWQMSQCPDLRGDAALVAYVPGPSPLYCFVSCLYGTLATGPQYYAAQTSGQIGYPSDLEAPSANLFFARLVSGAVDLAPSVCAPCVTTACPAPGTYRPAYPNASSACGPPCGLPPGSGVNPYQAECAAAGAPGAADGCVAACTNLPQNATFISGSASTGDASGCRWVCNQGSHIAENAAGCLPCALPSADAVADFCQGVDYAMVPPALCMPTDTRLTLCKSCRRVPFAQPPAWDPGAAGAAGACAYTCERGYYLTPGGSNGTGASCRPCDSVDPGACAVGAYLDVDTCVATQAAPQCQHCAPPPADEGMDGRYYSYTTNGGVNASGCHARCSVGFHTVRRSTAQYYDLYSPAQASGPPADDLLCVPCTLNDDRACASRGCPPAYWRNSSVPDGQPGGCLLCRTSETCPSGTHALPCAGNETSEPGCIPCPPFPATAHLVPVPYAALRRPNVVEGVPGGCPAACINNFVLDATGASCVSCGPGCEHPGVQPEICDFRYAYWNATPAAPWWDPASTPPLLLAMSRVYRWGPLWPRAGLCWACPPGTGTAAGDTDLCTILPGFSAQVVEDQGRPPIPSVPEGFAVLFNEPRPPAVNAQQGGFRRLMQEDDGGYVAPYLGVNITNLTVTVNASGGGGGAAELATVLPCPTGTYKPGQGDGACYLCPQRSSTVGPAATSPDHCICNFGSTREPATGVCVPCPPDTAGSRTTPGGPCTPCPRNETTFGLSGQTACACKIGTYRSGGGACQPCPADNYCLPCYEGEDNCPSAGVRITPCFLGSTSPPGSFAFDNCTCSPGEARVTRAPGLALYYCTTLPPGAGVTAGGLVACLPGWTAGTDGAGGLQCTLCPAGYYAEADPTTPTAARVDASGSATCSPCPRGTYSSSTTAIGAQCCQACPPLQTTPHAASTGRPQCACPATMGVDPATGLCVGCTPSQYQDPDTGGCQNCPPNSVATAGAFSEDACACSPGYEPSTVGCAQCKQGYYSGTAGRVPCTPCPPGSTTLSVGSASRLACGASAAQCDAGYVWRAGLGCFQS